MSCVKWGALGCFIPSISATTAPNAPPQYLWHRYSPRTPKAHTGQHVLRQGKNRRPHDECQTKNRTTQHIPQCARGTRLARKTRYSKAGASTPRRRQKAKSRQLAKRGPRGQSCLKSKQSKIQKLLTKRCPVDPIQDRMHLYTNRVASLLLYVNSLQHKPLAVTAKQSYDAG